jgi:2-polyprenyl-3-methyl-5-hydroxy-6-metoxy-1,4-benzoquinol methylase
MGLLIAELQPGIGVVGIDWDRRRIRAATAAAAGVESVSFESGDIREAEIPPSGCILMLDVLHYNPMEVQDAILDRAVAALVPGGVLLVRDLDIEGGWRARATVWQERFAGWIGLNRGAPLSFRSGRSICRYLEEAGLEVVVIGSSDGLPLANVLIEATKAEEPLLEGCPTQS